MIRKINPEFQSGVHLLEQSYNLLQNTKTTKKGMDFLVKGLHAKRAEWEKSHWRFFCERICLSHPIRHLVHQDPITFRSYSKPRGYSGDAVLMDFLYNHPSVREKVNRSTRIGQAIFDYHVTSPSAASVRWRREYLSQLIDETAHRVADPEILSVACGHLREAKFSAALQNDTVKRFIAFDQDPESLAIIEAERVSAKIECIQGTVKDLIRRKHNFGTFDLIYSAGLYDYLSDKAARLLTKILFGMLKKDGRLLIANFLPGTKECGYMEAFMGWKLLYRTKEHFERVVEPLSDYVQRIVFDDNRYVLYLEFRRR
ncbi:MAG: class I SAM-dependent methyltransferase [bacterium]